MTSELQALQFGHDSALVLAPSNWSDQQIAKAATGEWERAPYEEVWEVQGRSPHPGGQAHLVELRLVPAAKQNEVAEES